MCMVHMLKTFLMMIKRYQQTIKVTNLTILANQVLKLTINATWLRRHPTYSVYYVMVSKEGRECPKLKQKLKHCVSFKCGNFLFMSLIPVILLTILNFLIYRGVKRC